MNLNFWPFNRHTAPSPKPVPRTWTHHCSPDEASRLSQAKDALDLARSLWGDSKILARVVSSQRVTTLIGPAEREFKFWLAVREIMSANGPEWVTTTSSTAVVSFAPTAYSPVITVTETV